ncbi:response regulator [Vulgatibacter sp.]|uniref:response regulator n=1 Tax=Vulgatibacter sp. TaxID=1971226 RepID=UPI003568CD67
MAILCIDDDPQFCDAIAGVLADAGYRAVAARTAGEGLQHAREIDLAIVDLHLRGLSGDELVRAIREVRPIPVILTSGVPPEDGRLIARRCGAQHFLAKPFDLDELLRVVDTLLGEAKDAAREAASGAAPTKLRA